MIDQEARLRPGVDPDRCARVVLADGREWLLAKPVVRIVSSPGPDGHDYRLVVPGCAEFGEVRKRLDAAYDFAERLRAMADDDALAEYEAHPEFHLGGVEVQLGAALLRAAYDLTPEEVSDLVQFSTDEAGDPDGYRMRAEVLAVARGQAPKAVGGGSASE